MLGKLFELEIKEMFKPYSRTDTYEDFKEPYQLIIDKNLRSKQKRMQDDTREELQKVLGRVENVTNIYLFRWLFKPKILKIMWLNFSKPNRIKMASLFV